MSERPLVHVVVVDHDGGRLTVDCLRSIVASEWPADRLRVVLVDNASRAPVVDEVARVLPTVRTITSATNRGFAGGANLGMRERADADFVALVNNDATVTPGWLAPLVATFGADARIGAACPKILLASSAVDVTLDAPVRVRGRGDRRPLGVRVSGARVGIDDVWGRTQLVEGFWGYEPMPPGEARGQWTAAHAHLRVPVTGPGSGPAPDASADGGRVIGLRLAADAPVEVTVGSGSVTTRLAVGPTPAWYDVGTDAAPVDVLNNVGTVIAADGYGADRGWLEVDRGQYDAPVDVAAWCGAAVLLARGYLDDVGLFDERLFLYYEDVELSLRGATRGWRYRTAPESVVRHVHSATSVEGSPLAAHYNERNRLLVQCARASGADITRTLIRHLSVTGSYTVRDVISPLLHGHRPHTEIIDGRLRAFGAALVRIPEMRRAESSDGT